MAAPQSSLNAYLSWPATSRLLGLMLDNEALPARLACPLCQGRRFTAYEDVISAGIWFHCPDCDRAGDLIELAAAVGQMTLPAAVAHLARLNALLPPAALAPERINDYVRDYPSYRQRLTQLWQQAQQDLRQARLSHIPQLCRRLGLSRLLEPHQLSDVVNSLVGALPHDAVEAAFCPCSTGQGGSHAERYRLNPSRGRVFRGPGWSHVLVFPYYALPGRLSAFQFIGRQGEPHDRIFRTERVLTRSGSNQHVAKPPHRVEAGLAGLTTIDQAIARRDRTVFAVGDVTLAARLQLRNALDSLRPLPLVCWHDGARALTHSSWRLLAGRPVVFWSWRMESSVLYQAVQANGQVVVAGPERPSRQTIDHYLRLQDPLDRLRQLARRALPWRQAVQRWAAQQSDDVVAELWMDLEAYRLDLRWLAHECGGGRLLELLPPTVPYRTVSVGARRIAERADGWYVLGKGGKEVQLTSAILRIDVIRRRDHGVLLYQGRILFRDEEVPFEAAADVLQRQPARWLRQYLLEQGKGVVHIAPGVHGLIEIALKFHEPDLA